MKPEIKPPSFVFLSILLKTSITRRKRRRERGSPYLIPLELLKKPTGDPLINIEKRTEEIQDLIQLHHLAPKPILSKMYKRHSQLTWFYAFLMSNLQIIPGIPLLIWLSRLSFATRTESKI
jgi:hypothetical protein